MAKRKKKKPDKSCFTIMPFGGYFDEYYAEIYKPAIEESGLESLRADDLYRPSTIVTDIWNYTKQATLVLADLTDTNANVFYELGLAHALAKPVILITASMDDVPFDLRALRVLEYDKNKPAWGDTLKNNISSSITEILASPLDSVLPAFLDSKDGNHESEITPKQKTSQDLKTEVEVLRRQLELERQHGIGRITIDADDAIAEIRRFVNKGFPRSIIVRRLTEKGAPARWVEREIDRARKSRDFSSTSITSSVGTSSSVSSSSVSSSSSAASSEPLQDAPSVMTTAKKKTAKKKTAKKKTAKKKTAKKKTAKKAKR